MVVHLTHKGYDSEKVTVHGKRLGKVGVHPALKGDTRRWSVTSITTGLQICLVDTEEDATKIAEHLMKKAGWVFESDEAEEIVKKIPRILFLWVRNCNEQGRWVDPSEVRL